jgi:hypothetical protein
MLIKNNKLFLISSLILIFLIIISGCTSSTGDTGRVGATGAKGYTPVLGKDYFNASCLGSCINGTNGYTPIFGVDYFNGSNGYTPIKGIDYFDGSSGSSGYTPIKGIDYFDGINGTNGINGTTPDSSQTYLLNGSRSLTGNMNFNGYQISNLITGLTGDSGVNKSYVDSKASNYNASYWTGTNYNASYLTSTYNATYDAKPNSNYNASYWTGTNYNASYWTGTNYNATYDAKPNSNYNASYWTGTNYNASYWTGTNYNATYDAKPNSTYNASYVTTSNTSYVLTNNGTYILGSNTSYLLKSTWASYSPSLVWTGGTPTSITTTARWFKTDKVVYDIITIASANGNGATGLTISLPSTSPAVGVYPPISSYELVTAWTNPSGYLDTDNSLIKFRTFTICPIGTGIRIELECFYEVS